MTNNTDILSTVHLFLDTRMESNQFYQMSVKFKNGSSCDLGVALSYYCRQTKLSLQSTLGMKTMLGKNVLIKH